MARGSGIRAPALLGGGAQRWFGKHRGRFLGDDRALEEPRVLRAPRPHGIDKVKWRKLSSVISPSSTSSQASGNGSRMSMTSKCPMSEL